MKIALLTSKKILKMSTVVMPAATVVLNTVVELMVNMRL